MLNQLSTKKRGGFTLVEIMIVVAIIALLAAIAVPSFLRARERSQASTVLNNLRLLDAAKDQWALETNQVNGAAAVAFAAGPPESGVALYLKEGSPLREAAVGAAANNAFADPKFTTMSYELGDIGDPVGIDLNPFDPAVVPNNYFAGFWLNGVLVTPTTP